MNDVEDFIRVIESVRRGKISVATRAGLAAAKLRGVKLGGSNAKSIQNHDAAVDRAEHLRPVLQDLGSLSARQIAVALNERNTPTPAGGSWHAATVIRVQKRLTKET